MAHLLSPVCTETIKLQSQPPILLTPWRSLPKPSAAIGRGPARRNCSSLKVAARDSASTESVADDYYAVLGLVYMLFLFFIWILFSCSNLLGYLSLSFLVVLLRLDMNI